MSTRGFPSGMFSNALGCDVHLNNDTVHIFCSVRERIIIQNMFYDFDE